MLGTIWGPFNVGGDQQNGHTFKAFGLVDRGYGHPGLRPGLLTFKTFGLIAGLRFATIAQHSIQSMPRMTKSARAMMDIMGLMPALVGMRLPSAT